MRINEQLRLPDSLEGQEQYQEVKRLLEDMYSVLAQANNNSKYEYTPTGTPDVKGDAGDWAYDADYIYIKTELGWKRTALALF